MEILGNINHARITKINELCTFYISMFTIEKCDGEYLSRFCTNWIVNHKDQFTISMKFH